MISDMPGLQSKQSFSTSASSNSSDTGPWIPSTTGTKSPSFTLEVFADTGEVDMAGAPVKATAPKRTSPPRRTNNSSGRKPKAESGSASTGDPVVTVDATGSGQKEINAVSKPLTMNSGAANTLRETELERLDTFNESPQGKIDGKKTRAPSRRSSAGTFSRQESSEFQSRYIPMDDIASRSLPASQRPSAAFSDIGTRLMNEQREAEEKAIRKSHALEARKRLHEASVAKRAAEKQQMAENLKREKERNDEARSLKEYHAAKDKIAKSEQRAARANRTKMMRSDSVAMEKQQMVEHLKRETERNAETRSLKEYHAARDKKLTDEHRAADATRAKIMRSDSVAMEKQQMAERLKLEKERMDLAQCTREYLAATDKKITDEHRSREANNARFLKRQSSIAEKVQYLEHLKRETERNAEARSLKEFHAARDKKLTDEHRAAGATSAKFLQDEIKRNEIMNKVEMLKREAERHETRDALTAARRADDVRIQREAANSAMANRQFANEVKTAEERQKHQEQLVLRKALEAYREAQEEAKSPASRRVSASEGKFLGWAAQAEAATDAGTSLDGWPAPNSPRPPAD